ncbi:DUF4347 domain-containing protein [Methylomonas sp. LW13]|uniref:cadherin-like domain-containing protein n=1 Tax=unclassified Methylomonas TaxID=2608980 RepID=UPI00051CAA0D|nr:cadherin-like domain-containing protein [Methylomonas sp. LW13]QBC28774.1 DUF4347 domain-containing protein [Methylomonas sp. LW13]
MNSKSHLKHYHSKPILEELESRQLFSGGIEGLLTEQLMDPNATYTNATPPADTQQPPAQTSTSETSRNEIVFVDTRVQGYESLINDIKSSDVSNRNLEIITLDSSNDGIQQITQILAERDNLDAVHIISHGSDGSLDLGNSQLNFDTLIQNQTDISAWGDAFNANGDILIYGCNVAETQFGQSFVEYLSGITNIDVAASEDTTGSADLGGDWLLEYQTGDVETEVVVNAAGQSEWTGLMAVTANGTVTSTSSTSTNQLTWSHTVSAGFDRVLFVEIAIDDGSAGVNSVKYGTADLTRVGRTAANHAVEIWALVNPTAGTDNVVISFTGNTEAAAGASTFNGVNQSMPYGTYAGNTGTTGLLGGSGTVNVASATGDLVIDVQYWKAISADTSGTGQTSQWSSSPLLSTAKAGSSVAEGASSVTMSGSALLAADWSIGAVSIKASINTAPVNTVPAAQTTNEDTAKVFSSANGNAITITDADAGGANNEITLTVTNGTLTLGGTTGLTFVAGDGTADNTMRFRGTASAINTALNGLSFMPTAEYSGSATLTLATKDSVLLSLDIDTGLLGRYAFDNTSALETDSSPAAGSTASVVNGTSVNDTTRGNVLSLAGDGYVQTTGVYGQPSSVTLAAWVNLASADTGGAEVISLGDNVILRLDAGGKIKGSYVDSGTFRFTETATTLAGTGWHHVAYTIDSVAHTQAVYIDGVAVVSTAYTTSIAYSQGTNSFIGKHGNGGTTYDFNGKIDEARIYNRALTGAEIAALAGDLTLTDTDTVAITVTANNDAPLISAIEATTLAYTENGAATAITSGLVLTDVDNANLSSATVQITGNYASGQDVLAFTDQNGITGSWNASTGTLTLTGTASVAQYQTALRSVTYQNTSDAPSTASRTVSFSVTDGTTASNIGTRSISVAAVNDAPVNSLPANSYTAVNTSKTFSSANGNALQIADADAASSSVQVTLSISHGSLTLANTAGLNLVSGSNGSSSMTYSGTVSAINTALNNGLTFTPDSNYRGLAQLTITTSDQGNTGSGGTLTDTDILDVHVGAIVVTNTSDTISASADTSSISALIASDGGDGISLREAIAAANNTAGTDYIYFGISGSSVHTINLTAPLTITSQVVLDATSDDSFSANKPAIVLNGAGSIQDGIQLHGGSDGSIIRGLVIQNFTGSGINIAGSNGNTIAGNWIGLNATGTGAAGNAVGISIWNSANNIIGGSSAADRNVISGNTSLGIGLNTDNGSTTGNVIKGNYIGTDASGANAVGNANQGVWVSAAGNSIGGTVAGEGNVISGTTAWVGIQLEAPASNTLVAGNLIGLNATGNAALANAGGGIYVQSANNTIGGTTVAARNVISGNSSSGITLTGGSATGNVISGNYIGTDISGMIDLGNANSGITIESSGNTIGGTATGAGNLISGNNYSGVFINGESADNNIVQGNTIGTDVSGNASLANSWDGVSVIDGADNTLIGGTTAATRNIIAGNTEAGVYISDSGTTGTVVQGNYIGVGTDGVTALGNGMQGVAIENSATSSLIGSTTAGAGNIIANNDVGITAVGTGSSNVFLENSIYGNTRLGIDLGDNGATANDAGDVDSGPNSLLNTMVLTRAVVNGTNLTFSGTYNGATNSYYRIEVFSDATASGEGRTFLNALNMAVGSSGSVNMSFNFSDVRLATGQYITVTATRTDSSYSTFYETSEFSNTIVTATPDSAPVGQDHTIMVTEDTAYTFSTADFPFTDADGNNLSQVWIESLPGAGTLYLNGVAAQELDAISAADIQSGKLTYTPAANGTDATSFLFSIVDSGSNYGGGQTLDSTANTLTINISAVNDAPVLSATEGTTLAYTENGSATAITATLALSDADNTNLSGATVQITGNYASGQDVLAFTNQNGITGSWNSSTGTLTLTGTATVSQYQTALRSVTYQNTSDAPSTASRAVSFSVTDGTTASNIGTRSISVAAVNDAPVLSFATGSVSYPENAGAVILAPTATVTDADSTDFNGGQLVVSFSANGQAEDRLAIRNQGTASGQIGVSGSNVSYGGVVMGTFTGGTNGTTPLVISFNSNASVAAAQALGRNITYQNVSDAPSNLVRTLQGYLTDGDGGTSNVVSGTLSIIASNDAPVVTSASLTLTEGQTVTLSAANFGVTDPDNNSFTYTVSNVSGGIFQLTTNPGFNINSFTSTQLSNNQVQFVDDGNEVAPSFSVTVSDGSANSNTLAATINYTAANEAPTDIAATRYLSEQSYLTKSMYDLTLDTGHSGYGIVLDGVSYTRGLGTHPAASGNGYGYVDYAVNGATSFKATIGINDYQTGSYGKVQFYVYVDGVQTYSSPILNSTSTPIDLNIDVTGASTLRLAIDNANNGNAFDHGVWANARLEGGTVALASIAENTAIGTVVGSVVGVDNDLRENWSYALINDADGRFAINANTGQITVANDSLLNYEAATSQDIIIRATDTGGLSVDKTFTISLADVNEAPVISSASLTLNEGDTVTLSSANFGVSDPDNTSFTYTVSSVSGGYFQLSSAAGNSITQFTSADLSGGLVQFVDDGNEVAPSFSMTVNDGALNSNTLAATIHYTAVNDNTPVISSGSSASVNENSPINTVVYTATGSDADGNPLTWSLSGADAALLNIDANSGAVTLNAFADYESKASYSFNVVASDGTLSSSQAVTLAVVNLNDNPVSAVSDNNATANSVAENAANGSVVGITALATDADTGATISYSLTDNANGRFAIDSSTGVVTVADGSLLDYEAATSHSITVLATSSDGSTNSQSFTINITNLNDNAPVLSATNLTQSEGQTVTLSATDFVVSDADSSDFTFTISALTGGYFQLTTTPGIAITSFTGAQLVANQVQFVDDANEAPPNFNATASDGTLNSNTLAATINYSSLNDVPVLTSASLTLNEGETVTLSAANFGVTDPDNASVTYALSSVSGGYFQLTTNPGVSVTSFNSTQLAAGQVQFVDDSNEVAPRFDVTVSDGSLSSNTLSATIYYTGINDAPIINNLGLTVSEGETVTLSAAHFGITDPDSDSFTYTVGDVTGGYFQLASRAGLPITGFTSAQLTANQVQFIDDGNNESAPSFSLSVNDGLAGSTAMAAKINYIASNDTTNTLHDIIRYNPKNGLNDKNQGDDAQTHISASQHVSTDQFAVIVDLTPHADQLTHESPPDKQATDNRFILESNAWIDNGNSPRLSGLMDTNKNEEPRRNETSRKYHFESRIPSVDEYRIDSQTTLSEQEEVEFWNRLENIHKQMSDPTVVEDANPVNIKIILGTSTGLTAGFVSWILRAGSLMASFMSTVPLLKRFDPLPIMRSVKKSRLAKDHEAKELDSVSSCSEDTP